MRKGDTTLFVAFLAALVWAPLPFASNRLWGTALLAALLFGLLACWLFQRLAGKVAVSAEVWRFARWPMVLLLVVQLWVVIQLVPFPAQLVAWLSPQSHQWQFATDWQTLSLDPQYGRYYSLRGLAYTTGFFLTVVLVNSPRRVHLLLQVLVASGTFQAIYAVFMVLSGLELGFFVEKYTGLGVATGTFVNRNHLSGYLVMTLAAGTGLLIAQLKPVTTQRWRERLRDWLRLLLDPRFRLRIYLAMMVVALVLTRSRMGNLSFFMALGLSGVIAVYSGRGHVRRMLLLLGSMVLIDVLILGRWFGFGRVIDRLQSTDLAGEGRLWANPDLFEYVRAFPLTGSGGGSFYGIYPNFQSDTQSPFFVHAHNDYLEFAAELGLLAVLLLAVVVTLGLVSGIIAQVRRRNPLYRGAAFTVTMTILWALIHSQADFNLQIPANALTFTVILALGFVCRGLPSEKRVA